MTNPLDPSTEAWHLLREQIIETEQRATAGTNQARDALLEQGALFAEIAPPSQRGTSTGSGELLAQMAEECGIVPDTARHRRDFSAQMDARVHFKQLLAEAPDIAISWDAVRQIVLKAPEPEVFLTRKIKELREARQTRLRRDDVRREVGTKLLGKIRESEPEPVAPAVEPESAPVDFNIGPAWQKFLNGPVREVVDDDVEPERVTRLRPAPAPEEPSNQAMGWLERIEHYATLLQREGHGEQLRQAADYLNGLVDSLSAKDLTPEMFR